MTSSVDREKAIAIAVNLLKHKSPRLVQALKDLLTFIPNPDYSRDILMAAVIKLTHTCPEAALWLFQHPKMLVPHIQTRKVIAQELTQSLLSWGYTLEHFCFTGDYFLEMSEDMKRSLLAHQQETPGQALVDLVIVLLLL